MAKSNADTKTIRPPRKRGGGRDSEQFTSVGSLGGSDKAIAQAIEQAEAQVAALRRQLELAKLAAEAARPRPRAKVVLYPDGKGGFTVVVPALPGCVAEGDTREEALASLREAVEGYLLCTPGAFETEAEAIEEEIEL